MLLLVVVLALSLASPQPVVLPGAPAVGFNLFSGYVQVDAASQVRTKTKKAHFVLNGTTNCLEKSVLLFR
jgi:hypothetical protein